MRLLLELSMSPVAGACYTERPISSLHELNISSSWTCMHRALFRRTRHKLTPTPIPTLPPTPTPTPIPTPHKTPTLQVPKLALPDNISALAELASVEELQLDLSEDLELWLDSGLELSALSALRCLTITSGLLHGAVAQRLLAGLAGACPRLEVLRVLPGARSGLGDEEVPFLVAISGLKVRD